MKTFPTLYKTDSKGKIQSWDIASDIHQDGGIIRVVHGRVGGAMQETFDLIREGKNLGKANATTAAQQAEAEAEAKWTKQQERKGYKLSADAIDERPGIEPMLAHRYDQHPEKIKFPAFLQPKLDGHRCLAIVENGTAKLFSRKRSPITGLPHIEAALVRFVGESKERIEFDGELYNHTYKDKFEELTGFIRSQEPKEGHEAVEYHIYDTPHEIAYGLRLDILREQFGDQGSFGPLVLVQTEYVENEDSAMEWFGEFRTQGYEGAMLRNGEGLYLGKRSYDLQKMKSFVDDEFTIIGVGEGRGKLAGHAIFQCETKTGTQFDVKMKGELTKLKAIFDNQKAYIGKQLTVSYQGLTGANQVPRFPVGLRLREDL